MNNLNIKIKGGLKPTKKDNRDFQLGKIITLPKLSELPKEFELEPLSIKDQGDTDFCTAFATCGMRELQEKKELNPYWSFAVSKIISGDPEEWGQDIRTALKSHIKYGAIEEKGVEYWRKEDHQGEPIEKIARYIENYPKELFEKAKKHLAQSFFLVTGHYDHFDNIRASILVFVL